MQSAGAGNMDKQDHRGNTPLHDAAFAGQSDTVRTLLKTGSSSNQRNLEGETPLHLAAEGKHKDVVKILLDSGADPALQDNNGATPCLVAASTGAMEVMELLTRRDEKEEEKDGSKKLESSGDETIENTESKNGDKKLESSENKESNDGSKKSESSVDNKSENKEKKDGSKMLESSGDKTSENKEKKDGSKMLESSDDKKSENKESKNGDKKLESSENKESNDGSKKSESSGDKKIENKEVKSVNKISPRNKKNVPLKKGKTYAKLRHERNTSKRSEPSNTEEPQPSTSRCEEPQPLPSECEDRLGLSQLPKSTVPKFPPINLDWIADEFAGMPDEAIVRNTINEISRGRVDVNTTYYDGFTPLHMAVRYVAEEATRKFIKRKGDVNAITGTGQSMIMMAAAGGNVRIIKMLVKAGAKLMPPPEYFRGLTPIHAACYYGNDSAVKYFHSVGLDVDAPSRGNETALHIAIRTRNRGLTETLLNLGARTDIANNSGETALDVARKYGFTEVKEALEEWERKKMLEEQKKKKRKSKKVSRCKEPEPQPEPRPDSDYVA
ncbi:ankyrin-3 isoform X2 [Halyomorpha halys]|uniref:ankyrin-3 isoform X2 n=1 Tax=Halyomorpha halys TaxID=286706 RepID=UPI0006D52450